MTESFKLYEVLFLYLFALFSYCHYRIALLEKENKELKKEITELRSSSQIELEHVEKTKDLELKKVHEKIRQAMEKKERSLDILREQYEGTVKRADHLQMLLQRQRQELLKK